MHSLSSLALICMFVRRVRSLPSIYLWQITRLHIDWSAFVLLAFVKHAFRNCRTDVGSRFSVKVLMDFLRTCICNFYTESSKPWSSFLKLTYNSYIITENIANVEDDRFTVLPLGECHRMSMLILLGKGPVLLFYFVLSACFETAFRKLCNNRM